MARHEYRHKGKYVRISARKAHTQAQEKGVSFPFPFSLLFLFPFFLCLGCTCEPKRGITQSHSDYEQRWRRSSFPDYRDDLVKTLCLCTVRFCSLGYGTGVNTPRCTCEPCINQNPTGFPWQHGFPVSIAVGRSRNRFGRESSAHYKIIYKPNLTMMVSSNGA